MKIISKFLPVFLLCAYVFCVNEICLCDIVRVDETKLKQATLDELAIKAGTDKSSLGHNYTEVYDLVFAPMRKQPIKFLEIGIFNGDSIRLWNEYFEHKDTQLYFLDIAQNAIQLCGRIDLNQASLDRAHCYSCDQANKQQLLAFCKQSGGQFDVIIDDGGHTMEQQITSFAVLFPYVKSGGVYIVEDLHTSYWKVYGGDGSVAYPYKNKIQEAGPETTIHFLMNLINDLNYTGASTGCADYNKFSAQNFKNYYQRNIKSIQFYSSLCFIYKR